jgi:hypothetical protein
MPATKAPPQGRRRLCRRPVWCRWNRRVNIVQPPEARDTSGKATNKTKPTKEKPKAKATNAAKESSLPSRRLNGRGVALLRRCIIRERDAKIIARPQFIMQLWT